jgi:multicomponent Na+:H+ antiporter subunit F
MMNKKRMHWLIGAVTILTIGALAVFAPFPSSLGWQSEFLSRSFLCLILSGALALWRILRGPGAADRAVAMDMLGILIVGFCAILSIPTGRDWYIDISIAWALQSFIGIMALAKYIEGKDLDE